MLKENGKAFIHERVIYEYLHHRDQSDSLYLKCIYEDGIFNVKNKKVKCQNVYIENTFFPDVSNIKIVEFRRTVPAEVKFCTSEYSYHNQMNQEEKNMKYEEFVKKKGCIIVLKHDNLPKKLKEIHPDISVFEIFIEDFNLFVLENYNRLLHKQLQYRDDMNRKILLFCQTDNFHGERLKRSTKESGILLASESKIWCPTTNLSVYDIAPNDKVIFIRFRGANKQHVNKSVKNKSLDEKWIIKNLFIGKVNSKIISRTEYLMQNGLKEDTFLWPKEYENREIKNNKIWPLVFEFSEEQNIDVNLQVKKLLDKMGEEFVDKIISLYTSQNAIEIKNEEYVLFIETVLDMKIKETSPVDIKNQFILAHDNFSLNDGIFPEYN